MRRLNPRLSASISRHQSHPIANWEPGKKVSSSSFTSSAKRRMPCACPLILWRSSKHFATAQAKERRQNHRIDDAWRHGAITSVAIGHRACLAFRSLEFGNVWQSRPTKGGLNSKLHAVCDGAGRAVIFLLTGGQMSDRKGAALICPMLPDVETLIADTSAPPQLTRRASEKLHVKDSSPLAPFSQSGLETSCRALLAQDKWRRSGQPRPRG
jgi:hypothetical protein